ncbi:MAG: response regulator transcription factor [Caldilineaceae bacterium]|nr:response regulator transcription factor [Caldilineaceae bacterium]
MSVNVYIIEDHPITGQVLQTFLEKSSEWNFAGLARTGAEALATPIDTLTDLVLVDLSLPDMSGIQLLQEFHTRYPTLPCLVFSCYQDASHICCALQAGAKGYVVKDEFMALMPAMRKALVGEVFLSARVRQALAELA